MLCTLLLVMLANPPMVLWSAQPDESFIDIENIGDINGDGTDDIVAATTLYQSNGLYCFNGLTGDTLWVIHDLPGITLTGALCAIPDVNQDGYSDFALGTGWETGSFLGAVDVFSGLDGSSIWSRQTDWPVEAINYSTGSDSPYPILHATLWGSNGWTYFLALDGLDADSLWSRLTWTDDRKISVISDYSGNNWDEIVISQDRGYVACSLGEVIDGLTGSLLFSVGGAYFGSADATDTPLFILTACSWGFDNSFVGVDLISEDTLYTIPYEELYADTLKYLTGITGGNLEFPILAAWGAGSNLSLISGLSGSFLASNSYYSNIVLPDAYQVSEEQWNLAVLTTSQFHTSEPTNIKSSAFCDLPSSPGRDYCFLNSDQYPTPLAAVAISNVGGPGICTIATSWPNNINEQNSAPLPSTISLVCNPSNSGIYLNAEQVTANIQVLDITGRLVQSFQKLETGIHFLPLPPGVYHVIDRDNIHSNFRSVVLAE